MTGSELSEEKPSPECSLEKLDYDLMRKLIDFMHDKIALQDKKEIANNADFVLAMQNELFRKIAYSHGIFWDTFSCEWAFGIHLQEPLLMLHMRMLKDQAEVPTIINQLAADEQVDVDTVSSKSCRAIVEEALAPPAKVVKLALLMAEISTSIAAEVKKRPRANCKKRGGSGACFGNHYSQDIRRNAQWKLEHVHGIKLGGEKAWPGPSRGKKNWDRVKAVNGGDWPARGERKKGSHNSTIRKRIEIADYAIKVSQDEKGKVDARVASQFPETTRQLKQTGRVQTDACDILSDT